MPPTYDADDPDNPPPRGERSDTEPPAPPAPKQQVATPSDRELVGMDLGPREEASVAVYPESAGPVEIDVFLDDQDEHGEQHLLRYHAHAAPLPFEVLILYPDQFQGDDPSRGARVFEVSGRTWHVTDYPDRPPIVGCQVHVRAKTFSYSEATPVDTSAPNQESESK